MESSNSRAEAERLLGIAEKLLLNRDLNSAKDFAVLAQETEPLLDGPDQILAVTQVLLAADKRINNHPDWYGILQVERLSNDIEAVRKSYRRLVFLLHPDKNRYPFSDAAFKLVADAWAMLSDSNKKVVYDSQLGGVFSKVDLVKKNKQQHQQQNNQKLPVRRNDQGGGGSGVKKSVNFWTPCPYCYNLYEYPRVYEDCCVRCDNCQRAFTAAEITKMPPLVPGKEAYYCGWGCFPMGFALEGLQGNGVPIWMPPMVPSGVKIPPPEAQNDSSKERFVNVTEPAGAAGWQRGGGRGGFSGNVQKKMSVHTGLPKKRGRPRKNPLPQV